MAKLQTNPEGSNTVGDSKEGQDGSRDMLQSTGGEVFIPAVNKGEVQRKPKGKIWGGKFGLLLWKNYLLQKRHKCQLAAEIIVIPILFTSLLTYPPSPTPDMVPPLLMLTLLYPVTNICKSIVHEKERRLKESMKMMGLPNWLHWSAWLVKSLFLFVITSILITIAYQSPIMPTAVFTRSDPSLLFVFLMSYMFSSITFAFLVTSFSSKSIRAMMTCLLLYLIPLVVTIRFLGVIRKKDLGRGAKFVLGSSLVHNFAMGFGVIIMIALENAGEGMQWSNIGNGIPSFGNLSMLHVIGMLTLDGLLYLVLAIYIEAVFPGEFGVSLPFYFPLMPSYWCGGERSSGKVRPEDSSHDDTGFFEKEPENLNAGIQIKGLGKVFGRKVAVDGLTLNFYENQVTALLGHNGAGKTTTMSILTGLYPPSSGTALVNGFDIRKEMKSVQKSLGLCPQHDVLFDELTVEEHLRFFCLLKGYAHPIHPEIDRMLVALNLEDKKDTKSQRLSGGMKRKLCVGIALVGESKVVLLDEPTAGMDPGARRSIWDLISSQKQGRTILLSTHFMDEADLLGDRIAILAHGKAACCGSSLFLKQKYGGGYHLVIAKEPNCQVNKITELLQKYIPEAVMDQNVETELSYSLPDTKASIFPQAFEELEKRKAEFGVASYGCSITKMEEVFIRAGEQMEAQIQLKHVGYTNKPLEAATLVGNSQSILPSSRELSVQKSQIKTYSNEADGLLSEEPSQSNVTNQEVILEINNESVVKLEDSHSTKNTRNTGLVLKKQQLWAMLVKKWIYTKGNWLTYIVLGGLPVAFFALDPLINEYRRNGSTVANLHSTMSFFTAGFILLPIKEREVNSKHLQFVSGVSIFPFWLGHFIVDMGYYLIISILLTILWTYRGSWESIFEFSLVIVLYGWAVIPMTYLWSFRYTVSSTGYITTAFFYLILGGIAALNSSATKKVLGWLLLAFVPHLHLIVGTLKVYEDKNLWTWGVLHTYGDGGIGQHLFFLLISGLIYFALLFKIERPSSSRSSKKIDDFEEPTMLEDSEVAEENERIRNANLDELCMSETIVLKDLTKYYVWNRSGHGLLAVDKVCLGVQQGGCFGLLGVNGAGKSTMFKMLTGEIGITSGDAYITGKSVTSPLKDLEKVIGYCPQFDALIPELTGMETIRLFARLRGIRESEINRMVEKLAEDLLLSEYIGKPCGTYSGGNKRKLSTAIALIGSPSMVFLDEPTAGMDPVARRCLWNVINKVREAGSSVVLTSHSMEECEALCTRLAIMVNGKFRCLGSTQHLKNKFGDGYTLIAQMQASRVEQPERSSNQKRTSLETGRRRQSLNTPPEPWEEHLQPLRNFIEKNFSGCQLKDMHPCYVHYHWAQPPGRKCSR